MIELILLGGALWWMAKKGKEAIEDSSFPDAEFRLAKLAEKHRIPYESTDGTTITWDDAHALPPEPPEPRIEVHDRRALHQHVHFHVHRHDKP